MWKRPRVSARWMPCRLSGVSSADARLFGASPESRSAVMDSGPVPNGGASWNVGSTIQRLAREILDVIDQLVRGGRGRLHLFLRDRLGDRGVQLGRQRQVRDLLV